MEWQPYDPGWLVEQALNQKPELTELHEALRTCTKAQIDNEQPAEYGPVIYFVDRMEGQFRTNIILMSPEHGRKVVLDILEDGRVGSIAFIPVAPN